MGRPPTKARDNVYCRARKEAAMYDERLKSREGAAELLGLHPSTLADYELGNTKVMPVDKVVLMADLYKAPELKNHYCKCICPIGCDKNIATEVKDIQDIAINIINLLNKNNMVDMVKKLAEIAADKVVTSDELEDFKNIVDLFGEFQGKFSELDLVYQRESFERRI